MLPMVWSSLLMVNIAALGTYEKVSKLSKSCKIMKKINMSRTENLGVLLPCDLLLPVIEQEGLKGGGSIHPALPTSSSSARLDFEPVFLSAK